MIREYLTLFDCVIEFGTMGMFTVMCNMEGRCKAHKRLTVT